MAQDSTIITVGVIILIVILVVPAVLGRETIFEKIIDSIWNKILEVRDYLFRDWGNGTNQVGMGLSVTYTDGSTKEYSPQDVSTDFAVFHENKEVSRIVGVPQYKLSFEDTIMSITVYHNHTRYFDGTLKSSDTPSPDKGIPTSGEWKAISLSPSASQIFASDIINWDDGEYTTHTLEFKCHIIVDIQWNIASGEPNTRLQATSSATVSINVQQTEATLELRVTTVDFTIYKFPLT